MQVDFAPTLAALLGVPVPFGNIGRISRELWALRGHAIGYKAALAQNARQVHDSQPSWLGQSAAADRGGLFDLFSADGCAHF